MRKNKLKKVLFVATGALMSPTSSKQGNPIPGIAHFVFVSLKNSYMVFSAAGAMAAPILLASVMPKSQIVPIELRLCRLGTVFAYSEKDEEK